MEQVQGTEAVLRALQQLQDAVLATGTGAAGNKDIDSKLSELSVHLQALLQRHATFEQSCSDRALAEKALRSVINSKDAEAARLRSEITRLRHHLQLAATAADLQQQKQADTSAQQADAPCYPTARHAVLAAAVAAKDKPLAVVAQLESEVSACHNRIDTLESELAAAAIDNSSRLAEQQKAFLMKLEQLRHVHSQQLAAATQAAQVEEQQHKQACQDLQQQLQHTNQRGQQLQELVTSLEQQVHLLKVQLAAQQQTSDADSSGANSKQAQQSRPDNSSVNGTAAKEEVADAAAMSVKQAAADATALHLMEGQLARLSGIIKGHQAEVAQLRQTIMEGFAERQHLQQQLVALQEQQQVQQHQQQAASLPGALQSAKLGSVGRSNSPKTTSSSGCSVSRKNQQDKRGETSRQGRMVKS